MAIPKPLPSFLTQAYCREVLRYDPDTGLFFHLKRRGRIPLAEPIEAGSLTDTGYITICINFRNYKAHRLAWLYMTGEWPDLEIDHINRKRDDNRWSNLRLATTQEQQGNSLRSYGRLGVRGVRQAPWGGPNFTAMITLRENGKQRQVHLGTFPTVEAAKAAYDAAAKAKWGDFYEPS